MTADTATADQTLITDDEITELIDAEATEEGGEAAGGEEDKGDEKVASDATPEKAELSAEDQQWVQLRNLGVPPEQLVEYAKAGYEAKQAVAAQETKDKEAAAAKLAEEPTEGKPKYVTQDEVAKQITEMREDMQKVAAGANVQARLAMLLDTSGFDEENAIGRRIVTQKTLEAMSKGLPIDQAFGASKKEFTSYVDTLTAKAIRKKIEAKRTTGETGGGGGGAVEVQFKETKDEASDLDDGKALDEALHVMKQMGGKRRFAG